MKPNQRLFLILWLEGIVGVLSFLLVDLNVLINALPMAEGTQRPEIPMWLIQILAVIQPGVLMTLAVLIGVWLAPKVGLHSPAVEAIADNKPFLPVLRPQIMPAIIAGLLSGVAIVACWLLVKPFLTAEFIARAEAFNVMMPPITRFLYGGFTEEVLLRWGVMTLFVWGLWKILGRSSESSPRPIWFVIGIVASALLFGAGHLPIASALSGGLTVPLTIYVITANSIFGIVAGFLYWKRGLESAILAHILVHVVLLAAIRFS
ncbi:MAG: type II CAAX prenyl endopeptidase Rce1 family protein [Pyrinomonadaceae bacterium]